MMGDAGEAVAVMGWMDGVERACTRWEQDGDIDAVVAGK